MSMVPAFRSKQGDFEPGCSQPDTGELTALKGRDQAVAGTNRPSEGHSHLAALACSLALLGVLVGASEVLSSHRGSAEIAKAGEGDSSVSSKPRDWVREPSEAAVTSPAPGAAAGQGQP